MVKGLTAQGYVQAQAGMLKNPINEKSSDIGVGLGGRLNYKNTYLDAKLKAGTAIGAEVKLGHEFDLGNNFGLDTYGTASIYKGKDKTDNSNFEYKSVYNSAFNRDAQPHVWEESYNYDSKWTSGEKRMGVGAQLTFKAKNIKFGAGIEAGTRSTLQDKNITLQTPVTDIEYIETNDFTGAQVRDKRHFGGDTKTLDVHKSTTYITGTAFVDAKVSKHINLFANGRLNQGAEAGVRWTF